MRLLTLGVLLLANGPAVSGPARAAATARADDWDDALENSEGLPRDIPLAEAVDRFNQRTKKLVGTPNGNTQPPLRVDEVLAALNDRLANPSGLTEEGRRTYELIVKTRVLPRGAHLAVGRGWVGACPLGPGSRPVDVSSWVITLDVWMDRYPPGPGEDSPAPRLVIRTQHLEAKRSSLERQKCE